MGQDPNYLQKLLGKHKAPTAGEVLVAAQITDEKGGLLPDVTPQNPENTKTVSATLRELAYLVAAERSGALDVSADIMNATTEIATMVNGTNEKVPGGLNPEGLVDGIRLVFNQLSGPVTAR